MGRAQADMLEEGQRIISQKLRNMKKLAWLLWLDQERPCHILIGEIMLMNMNAPTSRQRKLIAALFGIVGLGLMLWKTSQVLSMHRTSNWPQAEAEILELNKLNLFLVMAVGQTNLMLIGR